MKEKSELKEKVIEEVLNDKWSEYILPLKTVLVNYKCAIMEIEAKFKGGDLIIILPKMTSTPHAIKIRIE